MARKSKRPVSKAEAGADFQRAFQRARTGTPIDPKKELQRAVQRARGGGAAPGAPPALSVDVTAKGGGEPGRFVSSETGRVSGITIPAVGGKPPRTFLGLSPDEVKEIMIKEGLVEADVPLISEQLGESGREEARETLEQAGALEEVTPSETQLTGITPPPPDVPIIGPAFRGTQTSILVAAMGEEMMGKLADRAFPAPLTEETIREAALREISKKSFEKSISNSESFGSIIEGIPIVGSLTRKYAGGLIEIPSSNADKVIENIKVLGEDASTGQEKVRNNLQDPAFGLEDARSMEEQIADLEGRLKLLVITSPVLQANIDELLRMGDAVNKAKKQVSRYKRASTFGLTAEQTGLGRVVPTDEQIFFELKGERT